MQPSSRTFLTGGLPWKSEILRQNPKIAIRWWWYFTFCKTVCQIFQPLAHTWVSRVRGRPQVQAPTEAAQKWHDRAFTWELGARWPFSTLRCGLGTANECMAKNEHSLLCSEQAHGPRCCTAMIWSLPCSACPCLRHPLSNTKTTQLTAPAPCRSGACLPWFRPPAQSGRCRTKQWLRWVRFPTADEVVLSS